MKKCSGLIVAALFLFLVAGCGNTEEPISPEPTPSPTALGVSDLNDFLRTIDLTAASLTCHRESEETYPASAAICAENYLEEFQNSTWEAYIPASQWDETDGSFYQLAAPGGSITTFSGRYDSNQPLHLVTDDGEGWFILAQTEPDQGSQTGEMTDRIFSSWYEEAEVAVLCGGTGTPLTAEELEYFRQYTGDAQAMYDGDDESLDRAAEIGCFFTSLYEDVRELNFAEFMRYFPGDSDTPSQVTDWEFEALKSVESWPFAEVETLSDMPVPVHKYLRSSVDEVLLKYAGITTAELDTTGVAYLEEYDAFYNYTSDFGLGVFLPYYGEQNGDIVTLWDAPARHDGSVSVLTLQKSGESWYILSHQTTATN